MWTIPTFTVCSSPPHLSLHPTPCFFSNLGWLLDCDFTSECGNALGSIISWLSVYFWCIYSLAILSLLFQLFINHDLKIWNEKMPEANTRCCETFLSCPHVWRPQCSVLFCPAHESYPSAVFPHYVHHILRSHIDLVSIWVLMWQYLVCSYFRLLNWITILSYYQSLLSSQAALMN